MLYIICANGTHSINPVFFSHSNLYYLSSIPISLRYVSNMEILAETFTNILQDELKADDS